MTHLDHRRVARMDWGTVLLSLAIVSLSLLLLYSAPSYGQSTRLHPIYLKQLLWLGLGCIAIGKRHADVDARAAGDPDPWQLRCGKQTCRSDDASVTRDDPGRHAAAKDGDRMSRCHEDTQRVREVTVERNRGNVRKPREPLLDFSLVQREQAASLEWREGLLHMRSDARRGAVDLDRS